MRLINRQLESTLPALYATDSTPAEDKQVICKFFALGSAATWLICEYDPEGRVFFGYADLFGQGTYGGAEWGYISLEELESLRLGSIPRVERDIHFTPRKFSECVDGEGRITV